MLKVGFRDARVRSVFVEQSVIQSLRIYVTELLYCVSYTEGGIDNTNHMNGCDLIQDAHLANN